MLRSALLRLLDITGLNVAVAVHGALTVALLVFLKLLQSQGAAPALLAAGLISSQICLATAWATWSADNFLTRFGRLAWQMAWLYLLLLVVQSFEERRHTAMLWCLPVTMLPYILSAWFSAVLFRWFSWRLVLTSAECRTQTPTPRNQFHLADVGRWMTLLCMLLAVMVCFRSELQGWDGLGYAVLMYFGLIASAPTGITVSLLLWLSLGERWTTPRTILASLLAAAWSAVSLAAARFASDSISNDGDMWLGTWFLTVVVCAVTLATAIVLRLLGWRLMRTRRARVSAD